MNAALAGFGLGLRFHRKRLRHDDEISVRLARRSPLLAAVLRHDHRHCDERPGQLLCAAPLLGDLRRRLTEPALAVLHQRQHHEQRYRQKQRQRAKQEKFEAQKAALGQFGFRFWKVKWPRCFRRACCLAHDSSLREHSVAPPIFRAHWAGILLEITILSWRNIA